MNVSIKTTHELVIQVLHSTPVRVSSVGRTTENTPYTGRHTGYGRVGPWTEGNGTIVKLYRLYMVLGRYTVSDHDFYTLETDRKFFNLGPDLTSCRQSS